MGQWLWTTVDKLHRDLGYGGAPNAHLRLMAVASAFLVEPLRERFQCRVHLPPIAGRTLQTQQPQPQLPAAVRERLPRRATADLDDYGFLAVGEAARTSTSTAAVGALPARAGRNTGLGIALKNDSAAPC